MTALASLRAQRARIDRQHGYRRRKGNVHHFSPEWVKHQSGRVFLGDESVTLEQRKLKYVRPTSPYYPYTPGELARLYLFRLVHEQSPGWYRITDHYRPTELDLKLLTTPAPLYFEPERGREGRFTYVDIEAAYFELFHIWPLNGSFWPQTGAVGIPRPALQIPPEDVSWLRRERAIRHAMFGMFHKSEMDYYKDGSWVRPKQTLLEYTSPDMVGLVMYSLHSIARAAIEHFDCRMWLTDAGIFPEHQALLFQLWLWQEWRLVSKPKAHGRGHLYAQGDYRIGRVASRMPHVDMPGWENLIEVPDGLSESRRLRLHLK